MLSGVVFSRCLPTSLTFKQRGGYNAGSMHYVATLVVLIFSCYGAAKLGAKHGRILSDWLKKKTRPLERLRAQGLEDLLNGSEQESALSSDAPDHHSRPEAPGSEAITVPRGDGDYLLLQLVY